MYLTRHKLEELADHIAAGDCEAAYQVLVDTFPHALLSLEAQRRLVEARRLPNPVMVPGATL